MRGTFWFVGGAALALWAGWGAFPRVLYRKHLQPLDFSHRVHTGEKVGSTCEDCHAISGDGRFAGIPKLAACTGCHAAAITEAASERLLVERYVTPSREIPWRVYSRQPDNVWFSHATHVKLAKLSCERCHGTHGRSDKLRVQEENRITGYSRDIWGASLSGISFRPPQRPSMKMDDCERCHREQGIVTGCVGCHK
jgi:hypothetical protein